MTCTAHEQVQGLAVLAKSNVLVQDCCFVLLIPYYDATARHISGRHAIAKSVPTGEAQR